jgi:L-rhamnose isomerase
LLRSYLQAQVKSHILYFLWDYYCLRENVPAGADYIAEINQSEAEVLAKR